MTARVLIVEDEVLIALDMEAMIEDLGHDPVGIAPDSDDALRLAETQQPDVALVDLHLRDGLTGPQIGKLLSELGITVVFVTANPRLLGDGIPGTIGVVPKPTDDRAIGGAIAYAMSVRHGRPMPPPPALQPFSHHA